MALLSAVCALAGCSDNGPAIGYVVGEVTLDGKPLENAMVLYSPITPGRPSLAVTNNEGRYELTFSGTRKGATVGDHTVTITTAQDANYDDFGNVTNAAVRERVPKEFNTDTQQRVSVEAGDNQIDFHIPSKK
ncbi:carboxypeptidase regulatory-like domain-containing protein [Blastopirellula sp. J2-11]|uniref:carboxypeptidase regulatory-like domain-containing protein n=1 Tax=Blastopirellula sp. J2-11 TaxID=2943192 RepID=UPI0021CA97F8|nr:carboxypeptidase regulatory-like domain-containing protein [Blastopirellula sp. J2-11]UUO09180.1 carboxypeptidase regulatory-like domain-containing protein [Blastopirellula sp. J2-11]